MTNQKNNRVQIRKGCYLATFKADGDRIRLYKNGRLMWNFESLTDEINVKRISDWIDRIIKEDEEYAAAEAKYGKDF